MTNEVLTFIFENKPLRITCLKDYNIYLFSKDTKLILIESLKSLPLGLSKHIIENHIDQFTENNDKKAFYHEGEITPLIKYVSLITLFQAFNNSEEEELKCMADDTTQIQIFLCKAIVEARKHFGIDMMSHMLEIIERAGDCTNINQIQSLKRVK